MPRDFMHERRPVDVILDGSVDLRIPAWLQDVNGLTEVLNMRKMGGRGRTARYGSERFNATAAGADDVDVVYEHKYTRGGQDYRDVYVFAGDYVYKADSIPQSSPGSGSLGTSLFTRASGGRLPRPTAMGGTMMWADGEEVVCVEGENWVPRGVFVATGLGSADTFDDEKDAEPVEYTEQAGDEDSTTEVVLDGLDTLANGHGWYVFADQPFNVVSVVVSKPNGNAAVLTGKKWTGTAWASLSITDGTASGGATLAQSGDISWTYDGDMKPRWLFGKYGYVVRFEVSALLDSEVRLSSIRVEKPIAEVKPLWSGQPIAPLAVFFYDASRDNHDDYWARVTGDQPTTYMRLGPAGEEMTSSDELLLLFDVPVETIWLWISDEYGNTAAQKISEVALWTGTWTAISPFWDGTLNSAGTVGLSQSGALQFSDPGTGVKRSVAGFEQNGYAYRIKVDGTLDNGADEIRIWKIEGLPAPQALGKYEFVVQWKGRMWLGAPEDEPNAFDYSAQDEPYVFSGGDSSQMWGRFKLPLPGRIVAAAPFYNELMVWQEDATWLLQGDSPSSFGQLLLDDEVGCIAPQTIRRAKLWVQHEETGQYTFKPVYLFQWRDGVYACDGLKVFKVSGPIDPVFDLNDSRSVGAAYLTDSRAFFDYYRNSYHFLFRTSAGDWKERVMDTVQMEWIEFEREVPARCGEVLTGSNGEPLIYYGGPNGRLYQAETNGYSDQDESGNNVGYTQRIETRAHWMGSQDVVYALRKVTLIGKARSAGSVTVQGRGNGADSPTAIGTISMVNAGASQFQVAISPDPDDLAFHSSIALIFSNSTAGVGMELYGYKMSVGDVSELAQI